MRDSDAKTGGCEDLRQHEDEIIECMLRERRGRGALAVPRRLFKRLLRRGGGDSDATFLNRRKDLAAYDIGNWTFGHLTVRAWAKGGQLRVGRFCGFAKGVSVYLGGDHPFEWVTTYAFPRLFRLVEQYPGYPRDVKGDVTIGSDVWIGENAMVMTGVTIGNGAVIGAGSVVRRDIPPYAIAVGNPARVAGYRFEQSIIEALERIAWWDWGIDRIRQAFPLLLSPEVQAFVAKYGGAGGRVDTQSASPAAGQGAGPES